MTDTPTTHSITSEDMQELSELFRLVYPAFIIEIDRAEATRGPLKEFHLAMATEHAKNSVRILGWDSRRTLNAIFDAYKAIYLEQGRIAADVWARDTFDCSLEPVLTDPEGVRELETKIDALQAQVQQKEAELLSLYRDLHLLQETLTVKTRPIVFGGTNLEGDNSSS